MGSPCHLLWWLIAHPLSSFSTIFSCLHRSMGENLNSFHTTHLSRKIPLAELSDVFLPKYMYNLFYSTIAHLYWHRRGSCKSMSFPDLELYGKKSPYTLASELPFQPAWGFHLASLASLGSRPMKWGHSVSKRSGYFFILYLLFFHVSPSLLMKSITFLSVW